MTFLTASHVGRSMYRRDVLISQSTFSVHGGAVREPLYLHVRVCQRKAGAQSRTCKYLQISPLRNFCSISEKNSGPVIVVLPGCVISMTEEKTESRTGSMHLGISQSSTKKVTTAYCLAGGALQYIAQSRWGFLLTI